MLWQNKICHKDRKCRGTSKEKIASHMKKCQSASIKQKYTKRLEGTIIQ